MSAAGVRHEEGAESERVEADDEACKEREDGTHCVCWWDGEKCCACNAAGMTEEEKRSGGMPAEDEPAPVDSAAGFPVEGTTAPEQSDIEKAWAEVDHCNAASDSAIEKASRAADIAEAAQVESERLYDRYASALLVARALGPRPAKEPS